MNNFMILGNLNSLIAEENKKREVEGATDSLSLQDLLTDVIADSLANTQDWD